MFTPNLSLTCGGAEVRKCGGAEVRKCGGAEVRHCHDCGIFTYSLQLRNDTLK